MQRPHDHQRVPRTRVAAMTKLPRRSRKKSAPIDAGRIGKLLRMLSSDKDGEVIAAVGALKRTLAAGDLDLHDLADAVEAGLGGQHQQPPADQRRTWGPPAPSGDDWQSMAWFCHHHRFELRKDDREFVADCLLGVAFYDYEGRCVQWHLQELRRIVASLRAA
jgi:hypothetical protein